MEQIFTCEACDGEGYTVHGAWTYEHGCGVPWRDTEERPCEKCNGAGWWIGDAEPDRIACD